MQCPRCRLENPPSAEVCDCGYSFVAGFRALQPDRSASGQRRAKTGYWFVLIPLSLLIWLFTAIKNEVRGPVSINVEATSGFPVRLQGTCEIMHGGSSQSEDFSGRTPFNKTFIGPAVVSCVVQNQSGRGDSFEVWIKSNGDTVAHGETSNPYGMVSVAANVR